jgi:hypothetical protein
VPEVRHGHPRPPARRVLQLGLVDERAGWALPTGPEGKRMSPYVNEQLPQALAAELERLAQANLEDVASQKILIAAREQLRALSWSRFKARHERSDKITVMHRRHRGHRRAQEGRIHA